jgi:ATP-dependent exoDNAse (exonuclease V) beta subunit
MIKFSKDGRVKFDSEKHIYTIGEKRLQGVTTFIESHKNPFDAEKIAAAYVKKHGGNVADLLAQWKLKADLSKEAGTKVHAIFEKYILTGDIDKSANEPKEKQAITFITNFFLKKRIIPVDCEVIVYNEKINLASQIDCVVRTPENKYYILDWKTNSEIKKDCFGKYMLKPFGMLPDASYYHYSMQLNIYKLLYKEYKIEGCFIVHIKEEDCEFIKTYDQPNLSHILGL